MSKNQTVNTDNEDNFDEEKEVSEMTEKKKMPLWKKIVIGSSAVLGAFAAGAITDKIVHGKKYSDKELGPDADFEDDDRYTEVGETCE